MDDNQQLSDRGRKIIEVLIELLEHQTGTKLEWHVKTEDETA